MKKSRLLLFGLSLSLTSSLMACSNVEDTEEITATVKTRPTMVEDTSVDIINKKLLVTQKGFLNGFPEDTLVEFKVVKEKKETLRVFEMGKEIAGYLKKEKQDGKQEFLLTYQESKDGITNPFLIKIEKMNTQK